MGEDRMNCMVRDPHWVYCYWELAGDALERAARGRSPRFSETARWVLRVSPVEGCAKGSAEGPGTPETEARDVEVDANARSWYLKVRPGTRMRVELGLVAVGGGFVPLVSGGEIETPPEPLSDIAASDWGPLKSELERFMEQGLVGSSATSFGSSLGCTTGCTTGSSTSGTSTSGAHASPVAPGGP